MATETSNNKNLEGYYRHPESGVVLHAEIDPVFGTAKADAFVRVGYVYVGTEDPDAPKTETKEDDKKEGKK